MLSISRLLALFAPLAVLAAGQSVSSVECRSGCSAFDSPLVPVLASTLATLLACVAILAFTPLRRPATTIGALPAVAGLVAFHYVVFTARGIDGPVWLPAALLFVPVAAWLGCRRLL